MAFGAQGITTILQQSREGEAEATERLLQLVYPELRRRAGALLRKERSGHTLQPTALVHETFLSLFGGEGIDCRDSQHFFVLAARCMRQILTDYARRRLSAKRGGVSQRVTFEDSDSWEDARAGFEELIAVSRALGELEGNDSRAAQIVEMRFFGGLTVEEVAEVLGISEAAVRADWRFARTWLRDHLS